MASPQPITDEAPTRHTPLGPGQLRVVVVAIMLCMALSALDLTIVSTAAPVIVGRLHGVEYLSWLFNSYILVSGICTSLYGKLADLYGTRRLYLFALSVFLLGSTLCGLAQSMPQLVAFRAVQGVGAGGLSVLTMTVITEIVPMKDRGKYMGMFGTVLGAGAIAGPLLGGLLTDALSWRWIFYVNLPLGLIALVALLRSLKLPARRSTMPIDYLGFVLLAALTGSITLLTSWAGDRYAWSSPTILGLAVLSALLVALFVVQERRAPEPLMPPRLFRVPTITIACLANVAVHTWATVVPAFVPMFVQFAMGRTATGTAVLQLPNILALMAVSALSGALITRWRRYKWAPMTGTALGVVSLYLFSTMSPTTSQFLVGAYMALFGFAIGLCMQPLLVAIQATAPQRDMGAANATGAFSQRIGGSLGFAALTALFSSWLSAAFAERLPAVTAAKVSHGSLSPAAINALPAPARETVRQIYADGISHVFLWTIPLLVAAFILSALLKNVRLTDDMEIDL